MKHLRCNKRSFAELRCEHEGNTKGERERSEEGGDEREERGEGSVEKGGRERRGVTRWEDTGVVKR